MTTAEFCCRSALSTSLIPVIDRFRAAFASLATVTSDRIYPDDLPNDFGIDYDDDLAMFLSSEGLLTNRDHRHNFPMEDVTGIADVFALTLRLNDESARHPWPNQGP
jgi:hypothetical protein